MENTLNISWNTSILRMIEERLKSEAPAEHEKYIKLDDDEKLEYIKKNRINLEFGYNQEILKDINATLHPLLAKVITEEVSKEIVENHLSKSNAAMHNIIEFGIILKKYANSIKPRSFEDESRLSLPYYLTIIESAFKEDINLLIYLLIKSNVKYYRKSEGNKELDKITDFNKIGQEKLYNKLSFLEDNGFSIISDACDRDLRNSIAHMKFIVFEDGSVAYGNKGIIIATKDNLENKVEKLLNVCHCIRVSIGQFYEQKYGFETE